jgi:hypothetical protein
MSHPTALPAQAIAVALPPGARINEFYPSPDLADAYSLPLPEDATQDPEQLARFLFAQQPAWANGLMAVRDGIVSLFGLKTGRQLRRDDGPARVGIFRVYEKHPHEIILGEDDRHLDFRASVLCRRDGPGGMARVTVTTVVHCHNRLGRTYIALITPFHRAIVRAMMERAARTGWPKA